MPGMNSGLNPADPTLVAAFRSALLHQGTIALVVIAFLWLAWATARTWRLTAPGGKPTAGQQAAARPAGGWAGGWTAGSWRRGGSAEPKGRRLLRVGFGLIWILDGILQAQPKMAGGLASQVIQPIAAASPAWVQHLVNWGGTVWSYHPDHVRRGLGLDPGRARRLAADRLTRAVVPAGRAGQRGLGTDRVDVRGGLRRDLRARPDLADRGARGRADLRGRRARSSRCRKARGGARAGGCSGRHRVVLHRHGGAAGVAGPRLLAGSRRQAGQPVRHGAVAWRTTSQPRFLVVAGVQLRVVRAAHGFAVNLFVVIALAAIGAALPDGGLGWSGTPRCWPRACLPRRLGARPGLRLLRRARHRPEQHDPDHPAGRRPATSRSPGRRTPPRSGKRRPGRRP